MLSEGYLSFSCGNTVMFVKEDGVNEWWYDQTMVWVALCFKYELNELNLPIRLHRRNDSKIRP